ncbi:MAG: phosphatidylserine decarboxylase [Candidatus Azotimanducaceae bacterium]
MFILFQKIAPQHLLSRLVGWVASSRIHWIKRTFIHWAIGRYQIDMTDALEADPDAYASFNAFFTRALKPGARPIGSSLCSPADGAISECGDIHAGQLLQAKGIHYSLEQLMAGGNPEAYRDGTFATVYLSPRDYHRVHCPIKGTLIAARYVPGKLFSVNQQTADAIPGLFAINERLVMEFETEEGPVCVIMVGAMIVAAVQPAWRDRPYPARSLVIESVADNISAKIANALFESGDELGRFLMGSTAIVLTAKRFSLKHKAGEGVRMGESLV